MKKIKVKNLNLFTINQLHELIKDLPMVLVFLLDVVLQDYLNETDKEKISCLIMN